MKESSTRERIFDFLLVALKQDSLSSTPVCLTSELGDDPPVEEIILIFRKSAYGCLAEDIASATTKLASATTRRFYEAGEAISIFNVSGNKLWFVSSDGNAYTNSVDIEHYRSY